MREVKKRLAGVAERKWEEKRGNDCIAAPACSACSEEENLETMHPRPSCMCTAKVPTFLTVDLDMA